MKSQSYSGLFRILLFAAILLAVLNIANAQQYSNDDLTSPDFNWNEVDMNQMTPAQFDAYYEKIPPAKLDAYFNTFASLTNNPAAANRYFGDAANIGRNPATEAAYFSNSANINRNLATARQHFELQTGNARAGRAEIRIISGVVYTSDTSQLANGRATIRLPQFQQGDIVEALEGGGFRINGVFFDGGDVDKKNTLITLTSGSNAVNFNMPPGQVTGSAAFTEKGFEFAGTASDGKATVGGVSIEFDSTKGIVNVLSDGTIVGQNADVSTPNGRLYSGNFETKGDETLLKQISGAQSTFYDSKNPLDIKVTTNGGNVAVHSNQLPADAVSKQNPEQPLTLEEAKARAAQAPPVSIPNGGEVWYKGKTVIAKGFAGVSGKDGLETFNFVGKGSSADFYRAPDPKKPQDIITTAKGIFKLDLSNRITADSTIYKGSNPEQISFVAKTTQKADAITIDAPDDGRDAMKVTRYLHEYDMISATGVRIVTDLGNVKFEVVASKSGGELNMKATEQTLSLLGKAREDPSIFVTLNGAKDFLLSDKSGNVQFGLTAEGGLFEKTAGGYVSILGPGRVVSALGKNEIVITQDQLSTVVPFLQQLSVLDAQGLASIQLSASDLATLNKIAKGNPALAKVIQCVGGDASCKNKEDFLQKYVEFNAAAKELTDAEASNDPNRIKNAKLAAGQKYFDMTIASGAKPSISISSPLAESYLEMSDAHITQAKKYEAQANDYLKQGDRVKYMEYVQKSKDEMQSSQAEIQNALGVSNQAGNLDLSRYVAARSRMTNLGAGEAAVNNIAESISSLGQIKSNSPLYAQASKTKSALESQMLNVIGQTAAAQSQAAIEKYQASYTHWYTTGLETAFANSYILGGARANVADYVIDDLSNQALGAMVLGKLVGSGYTINQVKSMSPAEKQQALKTVFPNADSSNIGAYASGIGSALSNPDVKALAYLEKGLTVKSVQQEMPPGKVATALGAQAQNVVFPGVQGGAQYTPDANMLDLTTAEKLWGMIPQVIVVPLAAEIGGAYITQLGAKIAPFITETQTFAKLATVGTDVAEAFTQVTKVTKVASGVKTLGTVGAEFGGSYVAQVGLEAVGVPPPVAMAISNIFSLNPAAPLKTAKNFVNDVEATKGIATIFRGEKEFIQEGFDDLGNIVLRSKETQELETMTVKDFGAAYRDGSLQIADDGLATSLKNAETANAEAVVTGARKNVLENMESTKIDRTRINEINGELGTNFMIDPNTGKLIGNADDFKKAFPEGITEIPCPS